MRIIYDAVKGIKLAISSDYNYHFDTKTGEFVRWGHTIDDDPICGPLEILDIEVSDICEGIPDIGRTIATPCTFCYKSNTRVGSNMSFDTFKTIFDKLPRTLTQVAFGIGNIDAMGPAHDSDLVRMFDYCRKNSHNYGVVPNLTINGWNLDDEWVKVLSSKLGGIAVSRYANKDVCYDAVKRLTDAGMKQCNIHAVLSNESLASCYQLIDDAVNDVRLAKMKAIVFLTMKPKGKRNKWTTLKDIDAYRKLIMYAFDRDIGIGFDSCSASTFLAAMKDHPRFAQFAQLSESCESALFSGYINVNGEFFPCSFTEGEGEWKNGIDVLAANNFESDVWNHEKTVSFRNKNIETTDKSICNDCRKCVTFPDLYDDSIVHRPHVDAMRKSINIIRA